MDLNAIENQKNRDFAEWCQHYEFYLRKMFDDFISPNFDMSYKDFTLLAYNNTFSYFVANKGRYMKRLI